MYEHYNVSAREFCTNKSRSARGLRTRVSFTPRRTRTPSRADSVLARHGAAHGEYVETFLFIDYRSFMPPKMTH